MRTQTKDGKNIHEYRCRAVRIKTWKYIHMKNDENYFPDWCPLEDIEEESYCNCNTRINEE